MPGSREGLTRSPFLSQAILDTVKEVFAIGPQDADHQLGLGRIRLLVVAAGEPAGKSLEQCQKVDVELTLDAGQEDYQLRLEYGVEGLRRSRILRLTAEAREYPLGCSATRTWRFACSTAVSAPSSATFRPCAAARIQVPQPRPTAGHRPRRNPLVRGLCVSTSKASRSTKSLADCITLSARLRTT